MAPHISDRFSTPIFYQLLFTRKMIIWTAYLPSMIIKIHLRNILRIKRLLNEFELLFLYPLHVLFSLALAYTYIMEMG